MGDVHANLTWDGPADMANIKLNFETYLQIIP